jgi:hypothetical protein
VRSSDCEPHREFIETWLRRQGNATAIDPDLVDTYGFTAAYNFVKRFVAKLRIREPEQFDRLSLLPGEEMQVDDGEGALTLGTPSAAPEAVSVCFHESIKRLY